ncbi:WXG100 family type VII secretion target [Goodfellowiella coeruleoviolacea]|uniref:PPE family protein n=1 Tax=Goodfellowiella coeruleoviolacea TaxID=334858 RepID=A0AAE3KJL5_9PSEU|nr:hypothetical protein [Goodfellowiella coeruleoviolacea]MCP2164438.1 PPE family protein [Goodfellowiella coeruleoviolacea]
MNESYPQPPRTEPANLNEPVDWMAWSHQELYDMIHTGVDLAAASAVVAGWTRLGNGLHDIAQQLLNAVQASESGWEGAAADQARQGMRAVADWTISTGDLAHQAASAVAAEIEHVELARATMPPPTATSSLDLSGFLPASTGTDPVAGGAEATHMSSASSDNKPGLIEGSGPADSAGGFVSVLGGDSGGSSSLVSGEVPDTSSGGGETVSGVYFLVGDPGNDLAANQASADAAHREAANVMSQFQANSSAVDSTVPSFYAPTNPVLDPSQKAVALPPTGTPTPVGAEPAGPVGGGAVVGGRTPGGYSGGYPGRIAALTPGVSGGTVTGRGGAFGIGAPGSQPGAGQSPLDRVGGRAGGVVANEPLAPRPGGAGGPGSGGLAAAARGGAGAGVGAGAGAGAGGYGGMPLGARGDDDREHRRPDYLEEDDNIFGLDGQYAPPVIGESSRGRHDDD